LLALTDKACMFCFAPLMAIYSILSIMNFTQ
jgi:hypothetical protein